MWVRCKMCVRCVGLNRQRERETAVNASNFGKFQIFMYVCVTPILSNGHCYYCCAWVYNRTNIPSWSWHSKSIESLFVEQFFDSHLNANVQGERIMRVFFMCSFWSRDSVNVNKIEKKSERKNETKGAEKQNDFRTSRISVQINTCTCLYARVCVCTSTFFALFHYFVSLHSFVAFAQHFVFDKMWVIRNSQKVFAT